MKITIKLANGATLDFEGDEQEFERVTAFLADPPESLTTDASERQGDRGVDHTGEDDDAGDGATLLTPANVAARFEQIEPRNDQERITIIGQMATESGQDGVSYEQLEILYRELGLPTPAQFPNKTLSNARTSGLMTPVRRGLWRPTYRGSNFARGFGRGERVPRRGRTRPAASDDREGGEPD